MKKLRIHYLQHVPFEKPGYIEAWAMAGGYPLTGTLLFGGGLIPSVDDFDWLVVLGGPMNIYEEEKYAWLKGEKAFISEAIAARKYVIGVCLGAQLVADALGAKVAPNPKKEIGWYPVASTGVKHPFASSLPSYFEAFHWHGDTFELPEGAVHLYQTEACPNQAFLFGDRVLGFQFHLEATPSTVSELLENSRDEIGEGDFVQTEDEIISKTRLCAQTNGHMKTMLDLMHISWSESR